MIINDDDALLEQSAIAVVGTDMERLALGLRVSVVTWRFVLNSSVMMNRQEKGSDVLTLNFSIIASERGLWRSAAAKSLDFVINFLYQLSGMF